MLAEQCQEQIGGWRKEQGKGVLLKMMERTMGEKETLRKKAFFFFKKKNHKRGHEGRSLSRPDLLVVAQTCI